MFRFLNHHFIGYISIGLFAVFIIIAVIYVVIICKTRNQYVIREMKTAADALLALASLLISLPFVEYILRSMEIIRSVTVSHTGDPRVIMGGIAAEILQYIIGFTGFILIYIVWGGLRMLQARAQKRLSL